MNMENLKQFNPEVNPNSDLKQLEEFRFELQALEHWMKTDSHINDEEQAKILKAKIAALEEKIQKQESKDEPDRDVENEDYDDELEAQILDVIKPVNFDWDNVDYRALREAIEEDPDLLELYSRAKQDLSKDGEIIRRKAAIIRMGKLVNSEDRNSLPGRFLLSKFESVHKASRVV